MERQGLYHNRRTWLSLLAICIAALPVVSQSRLLLQPAYSQNRISENASRCMLQDRKGYLWIGTIDGLNRYDGYRFHTYRPHPLDSTSISGKYISDILEDRHGNIWVATHYGLNRYRWDGDCFTTFTRSDGFPGTTVTDILEDSQKRLWVATFGGLSLWDEQKQRFTHFLPNGQPNSLLETDITGLGKSRDGGIWIGYHEKGISHFKDGRFRHFSITHANGKAFALRGIRDFREREDGRLWVGYEDGIVSFDPSTGIAEKKLDGKCWSFIEVESGKLWANIELDRLYEWRPEKNRFERIPVFHKGEKVRGDLVVYLKSHDGIIWATHRGLAKQDIFEKRFHHIAHEKNDPNSLSAEPVPTISADTNGNILALTHFGGINYFDAEKGKWQNHLTNPLFDNELKDCRMGDHHLSDGEQVWLVIQETLFRFNLRTGNIKKWAFSRHGPGQLDNITKDKRGQAWLTKNGRIYRFGPLTGQLHGRTPAGQANIVALHAGQDGQLWAASNSQLFRYEESRDTFLHFYTHREPPLKWQNLISLYSDSKGNIWMGRQFGLSRLDTRSLQLKRYTKADGLPNNHINAILEDGQGRLWLSTNNGLSCFDPSTETFRNFDKYDGLQDEIFLPCSAYKSADGTMYFGGVNGFNVFHPDSLPARNPHPPRLLITELKVSNQAVIPGESPILEKHISEAREIRLSYKDASVSFELLALGYSQPENNQYAYMIEGVDPGWVYTGKGRTASYTSLPRGKELLFKAKAANHDGAWSDEPAQLQIYVEPPFWEKNWFRLSLLALLAVCTAGLYRLRIRNINRRNSRLKEEVKRQTAEIERQAAGLRRANDGLREQAAVIKEQYEKLNQLNESQSRLFTSLSHEFRTPLTLLLGYLEELTQAEKPAELMREIMGKLQLNTRQLLKLVNQLMDTAKLESGQYSLQVSEGQLAQQARHWVDAFQIAANQKNIRLNLHVEEPFPAECWFDQDILQKVVNNLLSNALKFTPQGGEVTASIKAARHKPGRRKTSGEWLELRVSDTGNGIARSQLPHIFDRFYQADNPLTAGIQGTGIGLSLVKKLVELHKGRIEVESELARGSEFAVFLPIHNEAFAEGEMARQLAVHSSGYTPKTATEPSSGHFSHKGQKIADSQESPLVLLVEDNAQLREFINRQLSTHYRVLEKENGQAGWQAVLEQLPDLIISDVLMPGMDGFELCKKIKSNQRTSHIPTILLTALSEQEKKLEGLQTGADAYLPKPFSSKELLVRIDNLIAHRERLRQQFHKEVGLGQLPDGLNDTDRDFLNRLTALVEINLPNENFGIEEITRELGLSRTWLFRKLKSLTGMSVSEFIRDHRLRHAYHLLQQQKYTVSEVIHQTGFNTRSYFYQSFKNKFGKTPSQLTSKGEK